MTDLETRLVEALRQGAEAAPDASALAGAARARARKRRRTRVAAGAALAVLAVAVPSAIVASAGETDDDDRHTAADPPDTRVPDGYRAESWHGVTLLVPDTWTYGSLQDWCANGGDVGAPRIQRPETAALMILCTPASTYGVTFAPADGPAVEWPVAEQHSQAWPDGAFVGATTVDGVVVTVAAPDYAVALDVIGSARPIGPEGDPNGCPATLAEAGLQVPEGAMVVCRYDGGSLEQSESLTGDDAAAARSALEAAPADSRGCSAQPSGERTKVIVMRTSEAEATVVLGQDCPGVRGLGEDRLLTADVMYWALSPGWSGAVPGDIPLPQELRQE